MKVTISNWLVLLPLIAGFITTNAQTNGANMNEAKIRAYTLPDVLETATTSWLPQPKNGQPRSDPIFINCTSKYNLVNIQPKNSR